MGNLLALVGLFFAAMAGGAINSLAGGGSLVSFPALVAFGVPALMANATNTAALWPGSIGGALGFLPEVSAQRRVLLTLLVPSLIGGLLGAFILVNTPAALFQKIVPFLILFATILFAARDVFTRLAKSGSDTEGEVSWANKVGGIIFLTAISTYGGYFGAGQSIMMLAALSVMGMRDIHRMNGIKTALAVSINGIAFIFLALKGYIIWDLAILMGVGAVIGGFVAARISKRIDQRILRLTVIAVGLLVSVYLFLRA